MISRAITCAELFRSCLWPAREWVRAALPSGSIRGLLSASNQWWLDHGSDLHRKWSYIHYRLISFILRVEESKLIRAQKLDARNCDAVLITKSLEGFFLLLFSKTVCVLLSFGTFWKMLELKVNLLHSWLLFLPRYRWTFVCCCSFIFREALLSMRAFIIVVQDVYTRTSQILEWHRTDHSTHHPMKLSIISVCLSVWQKMKLVGHRDKAWLMSYHHA